MQLKDLKGIGDRRAKDFAKLGIATAEDLIRYYPRTYLDMTNRVSIREAVHNDMALVACKLIYAEPLKTRGKLKTVRALLEQGADNFTAVWFNRPYLAERLKPETHDVRRGIGVFSCIFIESSARHKTDAHTFHCIARARFL